MPVNLYRNDRKPDCVIDCYDGDQPKDLTPAISVKVIGLLDGIAKFSRAATSYGTNGRTNRVILQWAATDLDTAGKLTVEVEVTWSAGVVQTYRPRAGDGTDDYYNIRADLG